MCNDLCAQSIFYFFKKIRPCFRLAQATSGPKLPSRREAAPPNSDPEIYNTIPTFLRFQDGEQLLVSEPQKGRGDLTTLVSEEFV